MNILRHDNTNYFSKRVNASRMEDESKKKATTGYGGGIYSQDEADVKQWTRVCEEFSLW